MLKRVTKMLSTCDLNEELRSFSSKMDYLSAQQIDVLKAVEHAEIQPGKKRKREVELWCALVEEKKIKLQKIDSEFNKQGPSNELKIQLTKEIKEVEGLIQQGKFPSGVVLDSHSATRLEMVVNTLVGSRSAKNIEMITKLLKQDDVFAIGVFGMGGVGKTTLLKKIHNSLLSDSDIEGQVYWVTASRECNLQILQTAIGKCLGLDLSKEDDVERRRSLIFHRLSQLQKSVLIIDDMWNHFLTDQVGIPLNSCGCKVVITTRSEEVYRKMGCQKVIKVRPLLEDDAWFLFVEKSGEVAEDLYSTAKEIVKECGGLPLALNTMGCCMREVTDVQQWKNALYELRKPARRQDNDMDDEVFRVLQYSYDSLRDERLKQCFLSCVLFPEDWAIGRAELIDLWIMEGLLDDIESWENKENKGHTIVNNLEKSSLLEPALCCDEEKGVRMHDLVRDMAMIVTQHHPHFMAKARLELETVPGDELWTRDLVKVSLSHNNIKEIPLGMSPETSNLRVLILSDNPLYEIPDSLFVNMKALEVLDLSFTRVERLPDTVSDLVNLRALLLEGCGLLSYVPSVAKLTKLMTLYLPETDCLAPEGMERLKCLHKISNCRWRLSDLPRYNSFIQSCQLYSYNIWLYDDSNTFLYCVDAYKFFRSKKKGVMISGTKFGQTEITPVLPCNIQALYVHACTVEGQRSLGEVLPSLRDAKSLSQLMIEDCEGLKYVSSAPRCVSSVSSYLDNLECLNLIDLPDLRSIGGNGSFSSLPHLKELKIIGCMELEEIFESNREFLYAKKSLNPGVALPELLSLDLEDLPKLRNINSIQLHLCTSLERLHISDCAKLEGIVMSPTCDGDTVPIPCFRSLSVLYLTRLPLLRNINSIQLHLCTALEHLFIWDCAKLEEIVMSLTCDGDTVPIPCFRSLSELWLTGLPLLRNIYSIQLHLCTSLERLSISDCAKLEGIVMSPTCDGDTVPIPCFRSLSKLHLARLPLLSSIYQMRLHHATSLEDICIRDCPKLEGIFTSCTADTNTILTLPKLWSLVLRRLPNLSSVYTGLLMSASLRSLSLAVDECPKLKMLPLSYNLICDASESTLASLPTESENPEWWEPLNQDFPDDVIRLSDYILQARQSLLRHDNDDDKINRVSWLSLSTS
ncbi:putative disease resistance protein At5g05400 [Silene latifolia]|uniref:putative disease resistance protein At5g05400 n=1 Tax=Silene latifolia TaxID=37657 RepID=UPI003D76C177